MATPGKRKVDEGDANAASTTSKRVTPPKARKAETPARYTAPTQAQKRGPSPRWVPILMFGLWALGLLLIVLSYMGVLPGSEDNNGWYLVAGLISVLGGIMVATQYR